MFSKVINTIILLLLTLCLPVSGSIAAEKYSWQFAGNEEGCRVYTSAVSGKAYIAAKAECLIPARLEVIGVILRDIAGYPQWMQGCLETKMLKVEDDKGDVFILWFRQDITFFTDRDMILKSKTVCRADKGQCLVSAASTGEFSFDPGKGYVRMPSFHSFFLLEWVDREHTRVTYMIDPDLGRGIPAGAANRVIQAMPCATLKKMAQAAKKDQYREAAKTSKYARFVEEALKVGFR